MTLILSGTNGVSDIDGDASTPAVRGTDANSGIFFGADTVGVSTGGSEKVSVGASAVVINDGGADVDFRVESDTVENALFVDGSTGNVGVGRNSPGAQVEVSRSATDGFSTIRWSNTGASGKTYEIGLGGNTASAGFANNLYFYDSTAGATRMVIDTSGNVGIGTTSPSTYSNNTKLAVVGGEIALSNTGDARFYLYTGTTVRGLLYADTGRVQLEASGSNPLTFWTGSAERARIDSSGNVGIGTSSPTQKLDVSGNIKADSFLLDAVVASNYDIKMVRTSGDGGSNTVQTYWNITFGAGAAGGCLGAYDRTGTYVSPGTTISSSQTYTIYGFIGVAP